MNSFFIVVSDILIVATIFVAVVAFFYKKKVTESKDFTATKPKGKSDIEPFPSSSRASAQISPNEPDVFELRFENLPTLTETESAALIEIKDRKLLDRIDNAIPGTLQIVANAGAIHQYQQAVKNAGQVYQAIIPQGFILAKSNEMSGAVRGFYRGAKGIAGHANFVTKDINIGDKLATISVANAAMAVASMIVGQYYMSQINSKLSEINREIDKITIFLDKEYQSKIYALIAEIQKCSQFQVEIVENEELRKRELDHLRHCEHECAQLLGQANLTLKEFGSKGKLDYPNYEKYILEAQRWYQYQQILFRAMGEIAELTYALHLGNLSRENSYAMLRPYANQADEALKALEKWHGMNSDALQIDLKAGRRRRQGLDGTIHDVLADIFDDNLRYIEMPKGTVSMIKKQSSGQQSNLSFDDKTNADLYQKDVRLITKDGKLYYLPEQ